MLKVKKNSLLMIACLVWGIAGINILRIGLLAYPAYVTVGNIILSVAVFSVFQYFIFGKLVKKPTIGENLRPVEAADIMRINRMMIVASLIALVLFLAVRCVLCILL